MIARDVEAYRGRLLGLMRRLNRELLPLRDEARTGTGGEASGGLSDVPIHLADLASHQSEEDITLELLENEARAAAEVRNALDRIAAGTFGCCEACGRPIPPGRLRALPQTRFCIACARGFEAGTAG
jgi:RNA polymerase-binding transcription factor DksA